MRKVRAKQLMKQARENGRDGSVAVSYEYDRLKKEHKAHTQDPKFKYSARQLRLLKKREAAKAAAIAAAEKLNPSGKLHPKISKAIAKQYEQFRNRNPERRPKAKPWR